MDTKARTRSAVTLALLALVFVVGVAWAWSSVTDPFPEKADAPACTDAPVNRGDRITPGDVLVNVLNGSTTEGLAGETMDALVRKGFSEGAKGNTSAKTGASGAMIWADDPDSTAAKLLKGYLGKGTKIVQQSTANPGITVVVGEGFPGVRGGRTSIKATSDGYVCSPPAQAP
ncbi:LytR C-terminal domain-containing protein [Nocardioides sp. MH1]|uniref:LytR C-terminal domain-containing protein n=1 Tax=Nocardioides sp. MH1 TaxID=3242490 RepID=UPI0035220942